MQRQSMYIPRKDQRRCDTIVGREVRKLVFVPLLVIAALGAGCEPSGRSIELQQAPSSDEPVVTVASTTQMDVLNTMLPEHLAITRAYAVRSENETFGHYVAAKLRRPSDSLWNGRALAVWYMPDGMDVPGTPYAVDSTARGFGTTPGYEGVTPSTLRDHVEISALLDLTLARP